MSGSNHPMYRWSTRAPYRSSPPPGPNAEQSQYPRGLSPPIPSHVRGLRRMDARMDLEEAHHLAARSKITRLNSAVDMRALEYVTDYNDNLMCPICHCAFVDPVVLYDCDHTFCRECLQSSWTEHALGGVRGSCPTCRADTKLKGRSAVSKILLNILDELVVKCPRHEDGCTATLQRGAVSDHVNLYCGQSFVKCPADGCDQLVRRKDSDQCMHYGVSCIDCRETMSMAELETHWKTSCPDRKVLCKHCQSPVFYREFEFHTRSTCAFATVPCTGAAYGCPLRSERGAIDEHVKSCAFATFASFFEAQQKRIDDQEEKQILLDRKVRVLEGGFKSMQDILYNKSDRDVASANSTRLPRLDTNVQDADVQQAATMTTPSSTDGLSTDVNPPVQPSRRSLGRVDAAELQSFWNSAPTADTSPGSFDWPPEILREDVRTPPQILNERNVAAEYLSQVQDFDVPQSRSTDQRGPYASPAHHLLSMHENLREEVSRVANALNELEGRHSVLILNENMRLREELAFMAGQISNVARHVGWLTSARLQTHPRAGGSNQGRSEGSDPMQAGRSAVSMSTSAIRGTASASNGGRESLGMGRRLTDEGRTKL